MSTLSKPSPSFYFLSVIYRSDIFKLCDVRGNVENLLDLSSLEFFFPPTNPSRRLLDYYKNEMGDPLLRVLFFSLRPASRQHLVALKLKATKLEEHFSSHQKRSLNIDVGQVNLENMQLASGKMYAHRVYLGDGVYSDLHYQFKHSSYEPLPWCYPDYAQASVIEFFNHFRMMLLQVL